MKAIVYREYGSPDALRCEDVPRPVAGDTEVLLRVRAAALNPLDWHFMRGTPYIGRLVLGLRKPKMTRPGKDVAGEVEAVGESVTQLVPGDELEITVRGLPHAYRNVTAGEGDTVEIDVTGSAGGQWTLQQSSSGWKIYAGAPTTKTTRVRLSDDAAWRLLFNALKGDVARAAVQIEGRAELAEPLFAARSVIV